MMNGTWRFHNCVPIVFPPLGLATEDSRSSIHERSAALPSMRGQLPRSHHTRDRHNRKPHQVTLLNSILHRHHKDKMETIKKVFNLSLLYTKAMNKKKSHNVVKSEDFFPSTGGAARQESKGGARRKR